MPQSIAAVPAPSLHDRFLRSSLAPFVTHASLLGLTAAYFTVLYWLPLWAAFVPCVFLAHRIGVMLHEYFHGIALGTYRDNHAVVTAWDGLMMTFGVLEVARGMHLSHHKWLNEPVPHQEHTHVHEKEGFSFAAAFDAVRHVGWLLDGLRGKKPFVKGGRIMLGFVGSALVVWAWIAVGHGDMVWRSLVVMAYTVLVPITLRGAIEHAAPPGDAGYANEWRAFVPIFNINRHIHHHDDPTVPWYRLEWRSQNALPAVHYLTHWFGVYVWKTLVQMQPPPTRRARPRCTGRCTGACAKDADRAGCAVAVAANGAPGVPVGPPRRRVEGAGASGYVSGRSNAPSLAGVAER